MQHSDRIKRQAECGHRESPSDQRRHSDLDIALGAEIEQAQLAGHEEHIHHRPENAENIHPVLLGLLQLGAAGLEVLQLLLLPVEDLSDLHAGKVLGQVGVDIGGGVGDLAVDPTGKLSEDHGKQHHKRHEGILRPNGSDYS